MAIGRVKHKVMRGNGFGRQARSGMRPRGVFHFLSKTNLTRMARMR